MMRPFYVLNNIREKNNVSGIACVKIKTAAFIYLNCNINSYVLWYRLFPPKSHR